MAPISLLATPAAKNIEARIGAADFCRLARAIASAGNLFEAQHLVHAHERLAGVIKSAISAGAISDWSAIAEYRTLSSAFTESLRNMSAFDAALADGMVRAPLRSRNIVVLTGISGSSPGERAVKPISTLALGDALLDLRKSTAVVVTTKEVTNLSSAAPLFDSELRNGVVIATDSIFISSLIATTTPIPSAGNTYANVLTDFKALFGAITTHSASKLYFVASPANIKNLMFITSNQGAPVLSVLQAASPLVRGVIPSDAIAANAALLFDASQLAGNADPIRLDASEQTTLQMESAPDSPPTASTVMLSLFQTDHRALRAERFFGFTPLRSGAVASLSGVAY